MLFNILNKRLKYFLKGTIIVSQDFDFDFLFNLILEENLTQTHLSLLPLHKHLGSVPEAALTVSPVGAKGP